MRVVVMGGSFNPPTIAHLKMMCAALDQLGAEKGFFVPTADKSLRRKMRKAGFPEEALSEETDSTILPHQQANQKGQGRYPKTVILKGYKKAGLPMALHLCGKIAPVSRCISSIRQF